MAEDFLHPDSELVLGLVAPVGTDLDGLQAVLEDRLREHFGYEPDVVRLSKLIQQVELSVAVEEAPPVRRYNSYMTAGNAARKAANRGDFLALSAVYEILQKRPGGNNGRRQPLARRAHILRSLKHPMEVRTLRQIYGSGFFLIGASSPPDVRRRYLENDKNIDPTDVDALLKRDQDEGDPLGQRTRDTFELSDAYISLNGTDWKAELWRVLDLLFARPDVTPTRDEYAMFLAYAASLRSLDLSRQVGAVIASPDGEIISTGANDVPKSGGGLYGGDASDAQHRDWHHGCDANEVERNRITAQVIRALTGEKGEDDALVRAHEVALENTGLLDLTEFGRAVHAEMEALLACARSGVSPRGATLFSTTFPCHNCAKHIIAAGIARVVYVEPYPKSRAHQLHADALTLGDEAGKVRFEPFVGIGPRRFIDLFSMKLSSGTELKRKVRKSKGETVSWERGAAQLRVRMAPISYLDREEIAAKRLNDVFARQGES